jgi:hypothetical protein
VTFRCAGASDDRDEPVTGSATHVRGFLLLEHTGPWGKTALLDARLPAGLGAELRKRAAEHRIKILLVRRHGARRDPDRPSVLAAYADPVGSRLERTTVADLREVLDLDLSGLPRGRSLGLTETGDPVFAVCTNGRHDACCAERGRPVAAALAEAYPEQTWEVSHIGGDRFAANALVLPHGLYYGRLEAGSAVALAQRHEAGELDLDHLRGPSYAPMPVQHAEVALRRELEEPRLGAVRPTGWSAGDGMTTARFETPHGPYVVRVRTIPGPPCRLTCQAGRDNAPPNHQVVALEPDDAMTR